MKLLLPILLVLGSALVVAIKLLPWWGSLALFCGLVLGLKFLGGRMLKRLFLSLFNAKSAALRGAHAELHGITRAEPPKPDFDDEDEEDEEIEPETPQTYVHVDLTMHVPEDNSGKTPFQYWDPAELSIVPVDAKPGMDFDEDEDLGTIYGVEVYEDGNWVQVEGKLPGTQRIRLHAGVNRGVAFFKLRYYFEIIENRASV